MTVKDTKHSVLWALTGVALVLGSYAGGLFAGLELFFEDLLVTSVPIDERLVILAIDDGSIERIGQWPWPRKVFADVLEKFSENPPAAVGIDVLFSEPSREGAADDTALSRALSRTSFPVIQPALGSPLALDAGGARAENPLIPLKKFRTSENTLLGNVNLVVDRDNVTRRVALRVQTKIDGEDRQLPTFAYQVLNQEAPDDIVRITYAGMPGTIRTIPIWRILEEEIVLRDKYVFIGSTAPSLHDEQLTPVSRGTPMSGIEIQANIANMALGGYSLRTIPAVLAYLWLIAASLAPWLAFRFLSGARSALAASAGSGALSLVIVILLFEAGFVAPLVHVVLASLLGTLLAFGYRYFVTGREKRQLRHAFSKYVSPSVLSEIMSRPEIIKLGGEDRDVTVFFSDVRGFTTLSESMSPSDLVHFLNKYLTRMTDIALARGGVIDKYIGDAIMAFWGAPLENKNHPLDTLLCSLAMIEELRVFNEEATREGYTPIDIGIGLNSGTVTVGNMGSEQRFDYTVMGDPVNLASRLEGQTKTYSIHILISENTRRRITPEMEREHELLIRELDRIAVKGKKEPVVVYQVVDRDKQTFVADILSDFDDARRAYYAGDWIACKSAADRVLAVGTDGPAKLLKERAEHFIANPPQNWNGIYTLTSK